MTQAFILAVNNSDENQWFLKENIIKTYILAPEIHPCKIHLDA